VYFEVRGTLFDIMLYALVGIPLALSSTSTLTAETQSTLVCESGFLDLTIAGVSSICGTLFLLRNLFGQYLPAALALMVLAPRSSVSPQQYYPVLLHNRWVIVRLACA
jgi:hypothetical protein